MTLASPPADPARLLARWDRPVPRYTSYPPVPAWQRDLGEGEHRAALADLAGRPGEATGLYVHVPFCATRCLYCGCHVVVSSRATKADRYLDHLEREMALVHEALGRHPVDRLHVGGGTPNQLDADQLDRLGALLEAHFDLAGARECSIEADPRRVRPGQMAALARHGFSRISFGVQDVEPEVQQLIGRRQPLPVVARAVAEARGEGFRSVNIDLMYGLPGQTADSMARTLEAVLALAPDRLAAFGYAHVPWMQPHQRAIDEARLPTAAERLALWRQLVERLEGAGYVWIGLDHFARPEDALAVAAGEGRLHRDFMGYTAERVPHLLALGPSGIAEVAGRFLQNDGRLPRWEEELEAGRLPTARGHRLSRDDVARRDLILDLMCNLRVLAPPAGAPWAADYARLVDEAGADGLVEVEATGLRVTREGRFFLRTLASYLDAHLPTGPAAERMTRAV